MSNGSASMEEKTKGDLIIIGGHEDKQGDREILTAGLGQRGRGFRGLLTPSKLTVEVTPSVS